jgi:uncharacterized membrane protein YphA (DoxX/SURF4 family)
LRAALGLTAVVQGGVFLSERGHPTFVVWVVGFLAIVSGLSILIGFLTPVASILVGLGSVAVAFSWFPAATQSLLDSRLSIVLVVVVASAIVLLGPGAYSLDARLFGRREIFIPHTSRPPQ